MANDYLRVEDASVMFANRTEEFDVYHVDKFCVAGIGYVAAEDGKIVVQMHVDVNDRFFMTVVGGLKPEDYWKFVGGEDRTGDGVMHQIIRAENNGGETGSTDGSDAGPHSGAVPDTSTKLTALEGADLSKCLRQPVDVETLYSEICAKVKAPDGKLMRPEQVDGAGIGIRFTLDHLAASGHLAPDLASVKLEEPNLSNLPKNHSAEFWFDSEMWNCGISDNLSNKSTVYLSAARGINPKQAYDRAMEHME